MRRRLKLYAKWNNPGIVEWQVYNLGGGWSIWGEFDNCVSKKCLMERVLRIIRAPRKPPRRVYKMADVAVDYLLGMISDARLDSYEVRLGMDVGAADAYNRALVNAILSKLAPDQKIADSSDDEDDNGNPPELFVGMKLIYDAYDCPDSDELCEGWWAEVWAKFDLEGERCVVNWDHYMGPNIDDVDVEAMRRAAYKALKHAYNTPVRI
jgi:hypothetical protein